MESSVDRNVNDADRFLRDILNSKLPLSSGLAVCENFENKGKWTSTQMRQEGSEKEFLFKKSKENILRSLNNGLIHSFSGEDVIQEENRTNEGNNKMKEINAEAINSLKDFVELSQATLERQQTLMKKADGLDGKLDRLKEKKILLASLEAEMERKTRDRLKERSLHQETLGEKENTMNRNEIVSLQHKAQKNIIDDETKKVCKSIEATEVEIRRIGTEMDLSDKAKPYVQESCQWISLCTDYLRKYGGIRVDSVDGKLITLTVLKDSNSAFRRRDQREEGIKVVLGFGLKKGRPTLISVRIISDVSFEETLINTAIETNDIIRLLDEIQRRYHST